MITKFKIGDEVKQSVNYDHTRQSNNPNTFEGIECEKIRGIETVKDIIIKNGVVWYQIIMCGNYIREDYLELVKPKKITDWEKEIEN